MSKYSLRLWGGPYRVNTCIYCKTILDSRIAKKQPIPQICHVKYKDMLGEIPSDRTYSKTPGRSQRSIL